MEKMRLYEVKEVRKPTVIPAAYAQLVDTTFDGIRDYIVKKGGRRIDLRRDALYHAIKWDISPKGKEERGFPIKITRRMRSSLRQRDKNSDPQIQFEVEFNRKESIYGKVFMRWVLDTVHPIPWKIEFDERKAGIK